MSTPLSSRNIAHEHIHLSNAIDNVYVYIHADDDDDDYNKPKGKEKEKEKEMEKGYRRAEKVVAKTAPPSKFGKKKGNNFLPDNLYGSLSLLIAWMTFVTKMSTLLECCLLVTKVYFIMH